MKEYKNVIDILLDEDNCDSIILTDEDGVSIEFEQVAVIPRKEDDSLYCILKPITKMDDVADDEALVFKVNESDEMEPTLTSVSDKQIAKEIFDEYYQLVDEELKKKENE